MNKPTRNEERPPKVNYAELLKQKRKLLEDMKKDVAKQAAIRKNTLDEQMNKALGERRNAISALKKEHDAKQLVIKAHFDRSREEILQIYETKARELEKVRDDGLEEAKRSKEKAYTELRDNFDQAEAPHVRKHKHTCEDLIEAHAKNEVVQKEATDKLIAALLEDIKDVEEELAARRERAQTAAAPAAPATAP